MNSLQGHLLAASPRMADRNFAKAVILLLHHSQSGALGVVLNRPFTTNTEIAGSADQRRGKVMHPDTVHKDPCRERIFGRRYFLC